MRKSGGYFWVELSSNPLYRSDGSLEGFMVMASDITERKRIDQMKTKSPMIDSKKAPNKLSIALSIDVLPFLLSAFNAHGFLDAMWIPSSPDGAFKTFLRI